MNRKEPKAGEIWRHFKGEYYTIICIGHHSETKEKMVVYYRYTLTTNLNELEPCIRPLDMFMSEVDSKKYPAVTQKYRFEKVTEEDRGEIVRHLHKALEPKQTDVKQK